MVKTFTPISLEALMEQAEKHEPDKVKVWDVRGDHVNLGVEGDQYMISKGRSGHRREYRIGDTGMRTMMQLANLPVSLTKALEGDKALMATVVKHRLRSRDVDMKVSIKGKNILSVVRPNRTLIKNAQVLRAVTKVLKDPLIEKADFDRFGSLHMNVVSGSDKGEEIFADDRFKGGVHIMNSPIGVSRTLIEGYSVRLVCLNGMMAPGAVFNAPSVVRDDVSEFLGSNIVQAMGASSQLHSMIKELKNHAIDGDVRETVFGILEALKVPAELYEAIIHRAIKDGVKTIYDVMNAITYVASHHRDVRNNPAIRNNLMRFGGNLVQRSAELCETCSRPKVALNS